MQKETGVGFLMGTAAAPGRELNDSDREDAQEPCVQQHCQAPGFTPSPPNTDSRDGSEIYPQMRPCSPQKPNMGNCRSSAVG